MTLAADQQDIQVGHWSYSGTASFLAFDGQQLESDTWYRVEVVWGQSMLETRLFASDGSTLLNSVVADIRRIPATSGGIGLASSGAGSVRQFDTFMLRPDGARTPWSWHRERPPELRTLEIYPGADLNRDGQCGLPDIDLLVFQVANGLFVPEYDLNLDGLLDLVDVEVWLAAAAVCHGLPRPYLFGDANLDGVVDGSDFGIWNANKFSLAAAWSRADFNADGFVDGSDFGIWNSHKFQSSYDARMSDDRFARWLKREPTLEDATVVRLLVRERVGGGDRSDFRGLGPDHVMATLALGRVHSTASA